MSHDVQDLEKIVLSQKGKHFDTSNERESEQRETALSKSTSVHYHPNVESKSKSALLKVMKFCEKSRILLVMTTKKKDSAQSRNDKKDTDAENSKRTLSKIKFEHSYLVY